MPNRSRSLLVSSHEVPVSIAKAEDSPPFAWERVHQTVLQFENPLACQTSIAPPVMTDNLLAPMQRLVAMIKTLQSSLAPLESSTRGTPKDLQRLETLSPYVSEEAYDVLDALREEKRLETTGESTVRDQPQANSGCCPPTSQLITIDALIPSLLWSLARSSYSTMHLIEGIRSTCSRTGDDWASGMLRLVVMLEAETPTVRWAFDLATGYPAENLLEPTAIVQSDEFALPIRCAAAANSGSLCQVQHQLQALLKDLQTEVPGLKRLLQGVPVDLLQPGTDWQTGFLRLRLGFTFSAQIPNASSGEGAYWHPELIEAELMDESLGILQNNASPPSVAATHGIADRLSKAHVSVVNLFGRSLRSTTLVRVIDADPLEPYIQHLVQQQLEQGLLHLQSQVSQTDDEDAQLALIVQAAIASCGHPSASGMNLLQPMLLMDELVPKLLWSLTSSTYEIMQLAGGVPAQVLQPNANWQQGTLRLLAALHLNAASVGSQIDLSTGRSLQADITALSSDTIVQTHVLSNPQPTSIDTLTAHLQAQLDAAVVEYRLLKNGISIAWLEDVGQDWQSGTMELTVSLAFVPDRS